jgi:sodium-independent sulfate anion transporter 11
MAFFTRFEEQVRTDESLRKVGLYGKYIATVLPRAIAEYVIEKVPIVQWAPRYAPKWILNDLMAGLTVGVLLVCSWIPNSLSNSLIWLCRYPRA